MADETQEATTEQETPTEETGQEQEVEATEPVSEDKKPIEYEDFKLPEGFEVDEEMMNEFKPIAQELGLDQESAQKLIDLQTKYLSATQEAETQEWNDLVQQWENTSKTDKEFGGEKLPESQANAKKAVEELGTTDLKEVLEWSGLGNNPEMIRFFNRVYTQFLKEDIVESANTESVTTEKTHAQRLYPTMND